MTRPRRRQCRRPLQLLLLLLLVVASLLGLDVVAQDASPPPPVATTAVTGTGEGPLVVRVPGLTVLGAGLVEDALTRDLGGVFAPAPVRCVQLRDDQSPTFFASGPTTDGATTEAATAFELLFYVGSDPAGALLLNATTATASTTASTLEVDLEALTGLLRMRIATTVPELGALAAEGLTVERPGTNAEAVARLGPFAALGAVPGPTNGSFVRVDVTYRNLLSPENLTLALQYQTRRGLARFLQLPGLDRVWALGPPVAPPGTVLQLVQSYVALLSQTASVALDERQRLANLLIYGDPSRLVPVDSTATGPMTAPELRPALFLDLVTTLPTTPLLDPTRLLTLPYVFAAVAVEPLPSGNPPLPPPPAPAPGTTVIPASSPAEVLATMRKTQRFRYPTPADVAAGTTLPPADVRFPPPTGPLPMDALLPPSALCSEAGTYCTHVYWTNDLDAEFWVESIASVEPVAWNLVPGRVLCAVPSTAPAPGAPVNLVALADLPPLPGAAALGPIVGLGNTSTPIWTLATAPTARVPARLELAVHLRSRADNVTRLTVEIATDIRSPHQAATTVTSIARRDPGDGDGATATTATMPPIYETPSNVGVTFDAVFPGGREVALFLRLGPSGTTTKDTSQPCAHCQNAYDFCQRDPRCDALMRCVFRDGLEAAQVPATLLQSPTLQALADVSPFVRACLDPVPESPTTLADPGQWDALQALTGAMRCQLARVCAVRRARDYGLANLDDRVLLWDDAPGRQLLVGRPTLPAAPAAAWNVTLRLGPRVLCAFAVHGATTPADVEDVIARRCRFGSYLGTVRVQRMGPTTTASDPDGLEFRFDGLVGPMPTLEVVPLDPTRTFEPSVQITALPTLQLRVDVEDWATRLPPMPAPPPVDVCAGTCRRLALDVCLRDLACVAFTDCVTRVATGAGASAPSLPPGVNATIGDAIMDLFTRNAVGERLDLTAAVEFCHGPDDSPAWRVLVDASACYARHACPMSLQTLFPGATAAAQWAIAPATRTQRLLYQQQPLPEGTGGPLEALAPGAPLAVLQRDGSVLRETTDGLAAPALERALRRLLALDDLTVALIADSADGPDGSGGPRTIQWRVAYNHWLGRLPRVIADADAPRWVLVTEPTEHPPSYVLEMVAPAAVNGSSSSSSSSGGFDNGLGGGNDTTYIEIPA